jgi:hypothetical protein
VEGTVEDVDTDSVTMSMEDYTTIQISLVEWTLYRFEGREIQNEDQAAEAVLYLNKMGHTDVKLEETTRGRFKVYHGWR